MLTCTHCGRTDRFASYCACQPSESDALRKEVEFLKSIRGPIDAELRDCRKRVADDAEKFAKYISKDTDEILALQARIKTLEAEIESLKYRGPQAHSHKQVGYCETCRVAELEEAGRKAGEALRESQYLLGDCESREKGAIERMVDKALTLLQQTLERKETL